MARDDLQFIDLSDFTPGISTRYHASVVTPTTAFPGSTATGQHPQPDGYAQAEGTWGCVALPEGGIGPTPRWVHQQLGGNLVDADIGNLNHKWPDHVGDPALYNRRIAILDALCVSPIVWAPPFDEAVDRSFAPGEIFTVRQWWARRDDSGNEYPEQVWYLSNHRDYLGPALSSSGPASSIMSGENRDDPNTGSPFVARDVHPSRWTYGGGSLTQTRTLSHDEASQEFNNIFSNPYAVGIPIVVAGMGGVRYFAEGVEQLDNEGADNVRILTYPDASQSDDEGYGIFTVPQDQPVALPGFSIPWAQDEIRIGGTVFGHQGRLMSLGQLSGYKFSRRINYQGNDYAFRPPSEVVAYWPVSDVYNPAGSLGFVMLEESPSGYGAWCSVNANSLFLVKNVGGAVEISGDVENPTVTRLPGIPGVGFQANRGVMTEEGYIYGSASGVWCWTGSDTAKSVSSQLDPLFWLPEDVTTNLREPTAIRGSFGYSHPFVIAPNNYMLDVRTGGWWRHAPTPAQKASEGMIYGFNEVDCTGNWWGLPLSYLGGDPAPTGVHRRYFDRTSFRSDWQWQSQPLVRTRNRYLNYRQVTLVASGHGTVKVTIEGIDGETAEVVIEVDHDRPAMTVEGIAILTTDVHVTIHAEADNSTDPAPVVHRLSLGYREQQGVDRAGVLSRGPAPGGP